MVLAATAMLVAQTPLGRVRLISPDQLPKPYATPSARAAPILLRRKDDAPLRVPKGFRIQVFAKGLQSPRSLFTLPNGDVLVAESYRGRIALLRDTDGNGVADFRRVFASGLKLPYGMALKDGNLYVGNTNSVVRFSYRSGQTGGGKAEVVIPKLPSRGYRQHWTRNLTFDPTGRYLFVGVGSESNKSPEPPPRAAIMRYDSANNWKPEVFADGLRNPVGLAFRPGSAELWATCVERDYMGDDLVPDFLTRVSKGDFFGWPWLYIGNHRDPRVPLPRGFRRSARTPNVLFEAHSVPLGLVFYEGTMFPNEFRGDAFVALRGSTNRRILSGYEIARIDFENGRPVGGWQDFVTGWAPDRRKRGVYGRPVGLTVMRDGSLLISDEAAHKIWRVSYGG